MLWSAERTRDPDMSERQEGDLPGGAPDLLPLRPQQALPGAERDQVRGQAGPASVLQDPQPALPEDPQQEMFSTAEDKVQLRWKMMVMMETPGCVLQLPQEF